MQSTAEAVRQTAHEPDHPINRYPKRPHNELQISHLKWARRTADSPICLMPAGNSTAVARDCVAVAVEVNFGSGGLGRTPGTVVPIRVW